MLLNNIVETSFNIATKLNCHSFVKNEIAVFARTHLTNGFRDRNTLFNSGQIILVMHSRFFFQKYISLQFNDCIFFNSAAITD